MVADLARGNVYHYYFHQYDRPAVLNVAEEIANSKLGVANRAEAISLAIEHKLAK